MIKYVVEVNYYNFTFNEAADAVRFALSAKTHCDKGPDDISVGIVLEDVPEKDPEDNGEASAGAAMLREGY